MCFKPAEYPAERSPTAAELRSTFQGASHHPAVGLRVLGSWTGTQASKDSRIENDSILPNPEDTTLCHANNPPRLNKDWRQYLKEREY